MRMLSVATLFLGGLSFLPPGGGAAAGGPRVDILHPTELRHECGCSFDLSKHGLQSEAFQNTFLQWDTENNALMRIDGKLVRLKASQLRSKMKRKPDSVGDKEVFRLKGGSIEVMVSCTATRVCAPDDDSCESTDYFAKVSVKTPRGNTSLNATGICGC